MSKDANMGKAVNQLPSSPENDLKMQSSKIISTILVCLFSVVMWENQHVECLHSDLQYGGIYPNTKPIPTANCGRRISPERPNTTTTMLEPRVRSHYQHKRDAANRRVNKQSHSKPNCLAFFFRKKEQKAPIQHELRHPFWEMNIQSSIFQASEPMKILFYPDGQLQTETGHSGIWFFDNAGFHFVIPMRFNEGLARGEKVCEGVRKGGEISGTKKGGKLAIKIGKKKDKKTAKKESQNIQTNTQSPKKAAFSRLGSKFLTHMLGSTSIYSLLLPQIFQPYKHIGGQEEGKEIVLHFSAEFNWNTFRRNAVMHRGVISCDRVTNPPWLCRPVLGSFSAFSIPH